MTNFEAPLSTLDRRQVKYIVVGGAAGIAFGCSVATAIVSVWSS
jgi:hypothetical protein